MTKYKNFFDILKFLKETDSKMDTYTMKKVLEALELCLDKRSKSIHLDRLNDIRDACLKYMNLIEIHDRAIIFDLSEKLKQIRGVP